MLQTSYKEISHRAKMIKQLTSSTIMMFHGVIRPYFFATKMIEPRGCPEEEALFLCTLFLSGKSNTFFKVPIYVL